MLYNFDQIRKSSEINSVKWDFMEIQEKNVNHNTLPFWIADMDFSCPPPVLDAIRKRIDNTPLGYSMADSAYYEAVCSWMRQRFQWQIDPGDIYISSGVVQAIINLIKALTKPGDGIVIQQPVYYPFSAVIKHNERTVVNNPLEKHGTYAEINFGDLEEKAKNPATTMMIFCSPHNPVGRVWSKHELSRVSEICRDNDVILVSDEIHCDLLRKGKGVRHFSLAGLFPEDENIIICTSPSKTFNTAGLQISNIIIKNKKFQQQWTACTGPEFQSPLALASVKAAYTECDEWLDQLRDYLDANFSYLHHFLQTHLPGVTFHIPEGTYLAWLDFSGYGYPDKKLNEILVKKANVLLESGGIFGPEGKGFQRMNIACPRATLEKGLSRIAAALES